MEYPVAAFIGGLVGGALGGWLWPWLRRRRHLRQSRCRNPDHVNPEGNDPCPGNTTLCKRGQ